MFDSAAGQGRLIALLDLLRARQPTRTRLPSLATEETLVAQHLSEIEPARFAEITRVLADDGDSATPAPTPADALALRMLLDDYAAAVRRLRAVADVTGHTLSRVATTVKDGQRLVRKHARPGDVTPQ